MIDDSDADYERRRNFHSRHKTQNNKQYITAARKRRFQSRPAESADHTSCRISVLRILQHKGTEGERVMRAIKTHNTSKDKTIYPQRSRTQGHIRDRGDERQLGENQLMICALLLHDGH